MFRGISAINLDTKGRLAVPMRYRDKLQADCHCQLVATIDPEETCLLLYPLPEWEAIEAKLQALPSFNPVSRRIQRLLIGHATELEVDAGGRILLPTPLRDYASLDKKITLIGQGNKFEIWDEQQWHNNREKWLSEEASGKGELPEGMENLAL